MLPGSPAEKAGIEPTDILESIEGQSTREMSLPEIRSMLGGVPGSTVNVSVVRARRAEPQKIMITRDIVTFRRSPTKSWPEKSATSKLTR